MKDSTEEQSIWYGSDVHATVLTQHQGNNAWMHMSKSGITLMPATGAENWLRRHGHIPSLTMAAVSFGAGANPNESCSCLCQLGFTKCSPLLLWEWAQ